SVSQDRSERAAADDGRAKFAAAVAVRNGPGRYRLVPGQLPVALRDRAGPAAKAHRDRSWRRTVPGNPRTTRHVFRGRDVSQRVRRLLRPRPAVAGDTRAGAARGDGGHHPDVREAAGQVEVRGDIIVINSVNLARSE